jgi:hypothetical protein
MQQEAELSARALASEVDPATLAVSQGAEWKSLWVLLAVATANVILGIWRPRKDLPSVGNAKVRDSAVAVIRVPN